MLTTIGIKIRPLPKVEKEGCHFKGKLVFMLLEPSRQTPLKTKKATATTALKIAKS